MNKKRKKRKNKKPCKPIEELDLILPKELIDYLSEKQVLLLKCVMANYTLQDIAVHSKYSRTDIIDGLIDLGQSLGAYKLIACEICPKSVPNKDYLQGWLDCKKEARRIIYDKRKGWKTL